MRQPTADDKPRTSSRRSWQAGIAAVFMLVSASRSAATQHLVEAGTDWDHLAELARPGDEILLMPGMHRPAILKNLTGTAEQPITIHGLDPNDPPRFIGKRLALMLVNPRHVIVEGLRFERCEMTAIHALAEQDVANAAPAEGMPGPLVLRDLHIERTGPDDSARPIIIDRLRQVTIEQCVINGWTGWAVDVIACERVTMQACRFTPVEQYDSELAVALRGGTRDSTITQCRFENAGWLTAVRLGGVTSAAHLPAARAGETVEPVFDAVNCQLTHCLFIDQPCPVLLSHADRCAVRRCTIVRPQRWVFALLAENDDPRLGLTRRPTFAGNLVTWQAGDLAGLFLANNVTRDVKLVLESNLWWSDDPPAVRQRMLPTQVEESWPQELSLDPALDSDLRPTSDDAGLYGAKAP